MDNKVKILGAATVAAVALTAAIATSTPSQPVEALESVDSNITKIGYSYTEYDNGDGTYTLRSFSGDHRYKDEEGNWQDSVLAFENATDTWKMNKHNYFLTVQKDFSDDELIRYENHYEGANHAITYEPTMLAWVNKSTGDIQPWRTQQSVTGVLIDENRGVYYTNAFGNGIDFEINLQRNGFKKNIVIPSKPAQFPTPPTEDYQLYALFKYSGENLKVTKSEDGTEWNGVEVFSSLKGFTVSEIAKPAARTFIQPAMAYDADGRSLELDVFWALKNGNLWQAKKIPLNKLAQATYPVRLDTTSTYTTNSGDGCVGNFPYDTWANLQSRTSAEYPNYTNTDWTGGAIGVSVGVYRFSATQFSVERGFAAFDASAIDDAATVSTSSIFLYPRSAGQNNDAEGDANSTIAVVESTRGSINSVVTTDFNDAGSTAWSSEVDIADFVSAAGSSYVELPLNASGIANISLTGASDFAFRSGHDLHNDTPSTNGYTSIRVGAQESSEDPYIEITYSIGGGGGGDEVTYPSEHIWW